MTIIAGQSIILYIFMISVFSGVRYNTKIHFISVVLLPRLSQKVNTSLNFIVFVSSYLFLLSNCFLSIWSLLLIILFTSSCTPIILLVTNMFCTSLSYSNTTSLIFSLLIILATSSCTPISLLVTKIFCTSLSSSYTTS